MTEWFYDNPGTTGFLFPDALMAELAAVPGMAAIEMPLPADEDYATELARLRTTPKRWTRHSLRCGRRSRRMGACVS